MTEPAQPTATWPSLVQSIGGVPLFPGFLEPTWGCIDVVNELCKAISNPRGFFPQKFLYAGLHGARLWTDLCEGRSHIAEVYRRFPLTTSSSPLAKAFRNQAEKMMSGYTEKKLGVVALGAGTGKRETQICKWLADELELTRLDALVLDVSSELLGISLQKFKEQVGDRIHPHFAVMDFELSSGLEHLKWLRNNWGNHPVMFLLLGNTFGCVDEDLYLRRMAEVMQGNDLLLCESALVADTQARPDYQSATDPRADFICDPLRSLGLNPRREQLRRKLSSESGKWLKQEFHYEFSGADQSAGGSLTIEPKPTIVAGKTVGLLEVKELTATHTKEVFGQAFSNVELVNHEYGVQSPSSQGVCMGYVFASVPRSAAVSTNANSSVSLQQQILEIQFDAAALTFKIDGTPCDLFVTHFAFVFVLNQKPVGSISRSALHIQEAVIEWLAAHKTAAKKFPTKAQQKLVTLEAQKKSSDTDAISNLKDDVAKRLKEKAVTNVAAKKLLDIWPVSKQWAFKPASA